VKSGFEAIALADETVVRSLKTAFAAVPPLRGSSGRQVDIRQVSPHELGGIRSETNVLTLLLYRVDVNRAMRAGHAANRGTDGRHALPLDLFYLLTAWGANAVDEQLILGRAMQALAEASPLSGAVARANVGGHPDVEIEDLSVIIDELSNEAMMRIFDAFPVKYRLSVPYIARVARIALFDPGRRPPVRQGDLLLSQGAPT
jgi:hypothetical protein